MVRTAPGRGAIALTVAHAHALAITYAYAAGAVADAISDTYATTGGAWCTASVKTYPDSDQDEWYNDVKVRSNQPDASVTASGGDYSHSWWTDGSGSALVYLDGPPPGTEITVTVGGATCTRATSWALAARQA